MSAALNGPPGGPLGKVARDVDYVEKALQVVTIPTDLPLPDVDLTRPRPEMTDDLEALAKQYGLVGPVRRLVTALQGRGDVTPAE